MLTLNLTPLLLHLLYFFILSVPVNLVSPNATKEIRKLVIDFNDQRLAKYKQEWQHIKTSSIGPCQCSIDDESCKPECCCDYHCTAVEQLSFRRCHSTTLGSLKQCHFGEWSKDRFEWSSTAQLACSARDNSRQSYSYSTKQIWSDPHKLLSINAKHQFEWNVGSAEPSTDDAIQTIDRISSTKSIVEYKSGYRVALLRGESTVVTNQTVKWHGYWKLPFALAFDGGECNYLKHVQYMYNFESTCHRSVADLSRVCTSESSVSYTVYLKSGLFLYKHFIHDKYTLVDVQTNANYSPIYYDLKKQICYNVVDRVEYTVWHEGIFGISKVLVKLHQINVPITAKFIRQQFNVKFEWATEQETTRKRSVQSGYRYGQVVMFAEAKADNSSGVIGPRRLLGLHRAGTCSQTPLRPSTILFGLNQRDTCRLQLKLNGSRSDICDAMLAEISKHLDIDYYKLYVSINANASGTDQFGNSDKWLEMLNLEDKVNRSSESKCKQVTVGLAYQLYFAKTGSADFSQVQIVGGSTRSQKSDLSKIFRCSANGQCQLRLDIDLVSSVTFLDVTEPLRPNYAPPPSVKIELPSDFFYPFLTSDHLKFVPTSSAMFFFLICSTFLMS